MPRPLHRAELLAAQPVGLVTVVYAGRSYRFSTQPVTITKDDGTFLEYDGGIDGLDLNDALGGMAAEPEMQTIGVSVIFPDDVASLINQGYDLSLSAAEVAIHVPGQTWENRSRILSGSVVEPVYGEDGEPTDFSVEGSPVNDAGAFPPLAAIVSEDTYPAAPSASFGRIYPWVFGTPGQYINASGTTKTARGSPAIIIDDSSTPGTVDTLLICDGHVAATSVFVFSDSTVESLNVTNTTDGLGRNVAIIDVTTSVGTLTRTEDDYWIGWNGLGGALRDDRTGALTGAGEVQQAVMRRSSVPLDIGRWAAHMAQMNTYKLGGYIDETVVPWQWASDNVLTLLPMSLQGGPDGIAPVIWPLEATSNDAVELLNEGENVVRASRVTYLTNPRDQYEEVQIQFARQQKSGDYRKSLTLRATTLSASAESHPAYLARRGALRGAAAVKTETTDVVYDSPTAHRIAAGWLKAALPVREVVYQGGPELGWLQPGHVVQLTDSGLHFSAQVATVTGVSWVSMGAVALTVEIRTDPTRDSRKLP